MKLKVLGALGMVCALAACSGAQNTDEIQNLQPVAKLVPGSQNDLIASAGDRVFFELDKNELSVSSRATLDQQATWLARYPKVNVLIAGNCDDRGTEEYNIALGQRRANAVREYLEAKGVSAQRIQTISYGKDRPTADGDTPEAWAQNRNAITSIR